VALRAEELISPELVLVDADLASRARADLPDPEDTLDLPRRISAPPVPIESLPMPAEPPMPLEPLPMPVVQVMPVDDAAAAALRRLASIDVEVESSSSRWRVRPRVLVGVACAIAATIVIGAGLVDVRRGEPAATAGEAPPAVAGSESSSATEASGAPRSAGGTKAGGAESSASGTSTSATGARSLADTVSGKGRSLPKARPKEVAWKAAPRATSYHIEVFRGGVRLFVTDSPGNRVKVPATWDLGGIQRRLKPGDRLYVWPVASGRRQPAIIDGRLVGTVGQLKPPSRSGG